MKVINLTNLTIKSQINEEQQFPFIECSKNIKFDQDKTIIIGNDHKDSIEHIKKFSELENPGIIIFDAHPDCEDEGDILSYLINNKIIKKENIVLIGTRTWQKQELEFLRQNKIKFFSMKEISIEGKHEISESLMSVARNFKNLYISIDIDVLDPAFTHVKTPEPGGLSTRELIFFVQRLKRLINFKAADIMECEDANLVSKIVSELY